MNETDSEDELENAVPVTMRPPCNTDSLVQKKKNRLDAWVANKEQAEKDVRHIKEAAVTMRREFERIEAEQTMRGKKLERSSMISEGSSVVTVPGCHRGLRTYSPRRLLTTKASGEMEFSDPDMI